MGETQFLAQMILKLIPFGDKLVDEQGKQASEFHQFTVAEVGRLITIARHDCPTPERKEEAD